MCVCAKTGPETTAPSAAARSIAFMESSDRNLRVRCGRCARGLNDARAARRGDGRHGARSHKGEVRGVVEVTRWQSRLVADDGRTVRAEQRVEHEPAERAADDRRQPEKPE